MWRYRVKLPWERLRGRRLNEYNDTQGWNPEFYHWVNSTMPNRWNWIGLDSRGEGWVIIAFRDEQDAVLFKMVWG